MILFSLALNFQVSLLPYAHHNLYTFLFYTKLYRILYLKSLCLTGYSSFLNLCVSNDIEDKG